MKGVVRIGDISAGHTPWSPRVAIEGSAKTFIDGKAVNRMGDTWSPHIPPHPGPLDTSVASSKKTFSDGKAWALLGDSISCGDTMAIASNKTFSV